jgi:OOP family OmpA-OmpF porin
MASFIVAARPAAAQDVYLGASLGAAKAKQICANVDSCDAKETSGRLFGGYQVNRYLAVEAGYQYFGTFIQGTRGVFSSAVDLVAVGSWHFTQDLSVYGKAGGYVARTRSAPAAEDNSDFAYGIGAEWRVFKEWSVRGEWQRYYNLGGGDIGLSTDIDVWSAAIVWRPR